MKTPEALEPLVEYGIIQEVVRPLMSGKEAHVYVVVADGEECVAKVYREADQRSFKHRSDYTEGRRTRNTRDQRAISKRTQHGRRKDEDAWRSTEVEMVYRLRDAGVRVPEPINFVEGVLVMELVRDAEGHAAPRLGDLTFSRSEAREIYHKLLREVVRMLCAGVIHADLSDFNVLMGHDGPVLIDFPQSVDPAHNPSSEKLLLRDVDNLHRFLARFAPGERMRPYGEEIWSLFKANRLEPETRLKGVHRGPVGKVDTSEVMALIEHDGRDQQRRRGGRRPDADEDRGGSAKARAEAPTPFRKVVDFTGEAGNGRSGGNREKARGARPARRRRTGSDQPAAGAGPASGSGARSEAASAGRQRRGGGSRSEPAGEARERPARSESTAVDAAKPAGARRRRSRRRRPRTEGTGEARPEGAQASGGRGQRAREGTRNDARGEPARASASQADAKSGTKGSANRPPDPGGARPAGKEAGGDRPPRRRRRRARKASPPK